MKASFYWMVFSGDVVYINAEKLSLLPECWVKRDSFSKQGTCS